MFARSEIMGDYNIAPNLRVAFKGLGARERGALMSLGVKG